MSKLSREVRRIENLYSAWRKVRYNVVSSGSAKFKSEISEIDINPVKYLRRIQNALGKNKFKFDSQYGRVKKDRPLIVSSIRNRIVQRAILNVLQSNHKNIKPYLGEIPKAINTPTSIGGIQERGVAYGMNLIKAEIADGKSYYIKSDIEKFFTRVPKTNIVSFIRHQTNDKNFSILFEKALSTELENIDEIKEQIHLFPISDTGIPQGSSLSALSGNIVLAEFDSKMNGRGIKTFRYIDDFVMLGTSQSQLNKAFENGQAVLNELGMRAYSPSDITDKSSAGEILSGFNFLGCWVEANNISAGKNACTKLLTEINESLKQSQRDIDSFYNESNSRRAENALVQTLSKIDRKIRGWGDSFNFTNNRRPMIMLDEKLDELINNFVGKNLRNIKRVTSYQRRRALGIALLADTPHYIKKTL